MIPDLINKFRSLNGVGNVQNWDHGLGLHCSMHCLAMTHRGNLYHADECYLDGCREAVAFIGYSDWWQDRIIFDVLGTSEPHRKILLECNTMGYGYQYDNWKIYLTIRGK